MEKTTSQNGLTIGKRLSLGFAVVQIMLVALTIVGIQNVNEIDDTLTEITEVNAVKQRYAINFRGSVHDRAISIRDVVLSQSESDLKIRLKEIDDLGDFYAESAKKLDAMFRTRDDITQEERNILRKIKQIEKDILPQVETVIKLQGEGKQQEAHDLLLEKARPLFVSWLATINEFIDYQEERNQEATAHARSIAGGFANLMIVLAIAAVIIGILISLYLTRYIVRSLGGEPREAAEIVTDLANGNLARELSVSHEASMLGSVKRMQETLRDVFQRYNEKAKALTITSERLQGMANTMSDQAAEALSESSEAQKVSNELIDNIAVINQSSQQVSDAVNVLSTGFTEMSGTISEVAENCAQETEIAQNANEKAERSRVVMDELSDAGNEIGKVIELINSIADQTNLLALNATIEAASAGEAGKGFAVVASEVKELARQTGDATSSIATKIETIQEKTNVSMASIEEVSDAVKEVTKRSGSIAAAVEQQNAMIAEISNSMNDITAAIQEVFSKVEQSNDHCKALEQNISTTTQSVESTSQSSKELLQSSGDLSEIASSIEQSLKVFRLK